MIRQIQSVEPVDVAVIGGGPNGLYCAFRLRQEFPHLRVVVFESGRILENLRGFPDVIWHSEMGELKFPSSINGAINDSYRPTTSELIRYYEYFASEQSITVHENSRVIRIEGVKDSVARFQITINDAHAVSAFSVRYIVLCTGQFGNPKKIDVELGEARVTRSFDTNTRGKRVVVVGSGNFAVDCITYLLPFNTMHWVFRSSTWQKPFYSVVEQFEGVLQNFGHNLRIHANSNVVKFEGSSQMYLDSGERIEYDICHSLIGATPKSHLVEVSEIATVGDSLALNSYRETSVRGLFAFGSVASQSNTEGDAPVFIHNGNENILRKVASRIAIYEADFMSSPHAQVLHRDDDDDVPAASVTERLNSAPKRWRAGAVSRIIPRLLFPR